MLGNLSYKPRGYHSKYNQATFWEMRLLTKSAQYQESKVIVLRADSILCASWYLRSKYTLASL
jgi:hypothetical protein